MLDTVSISDFSTVAENWHTAFNKGAWTIYPTMEVLRCYIEEAEHDLTRRERCIKEGLGDPGRTPYRAPSQVCIENNIVSSC